jgi:predicted DNA-binding transcriptional regulator
LKRFSFVVVVVVVVFCFFVLLCLGFLRQDLFKKPWLGWNYHRESPQPLLPKLWD